MGCQSKSNLSPPASTLPARQPGLRPAHGPLHGLYEPRGHNDSDGPTWRNVMGDLRGCFTRACEVSGDNEEIDDPMRRRDRGELRRHHEATDGTHPSTILQLLGLHLEIATDDERQSLGDEPLANHTEDLPVFLGETCFCVHVH